MSTIPLGFGEENALRLSKSADVEETLPLPSDYDVTGYTGQLQIRETEAATTALLTVTQAENVNGSVMTFDGRYITLLIKAADVAPLPNNADDADDPWLGVYEWVVTDLNGLTTRLCSGPLIAEKGVVR